MSAMGFPMPAYASAGSCGSSATMTSVVSRRPTTLAAFCSATRVTFVGSIMPASIRSTYVSVLAS